MIGRGIDGLVRWRRAGTGYMIRRRLVKQMNILPG